MSVEQQWILGAGMTGLAASWASGVTALEAAGTAGGICLSYGVDGYRFETGGGHWIFGGDPILNRFLRRLTPLREYRRVSSVWLPEWNHFVPYPIQNHLHALPKEMARAILDEMKSAPAERSGVLSEWLRESVGPTLYNLFFGPFHDLYTAGQSAHIAVQDVFKTPLDLRAVERGLAGAAPETGYNQTFLYPSAGLDALVQALAAQGDIRLDSRAAAIDLPRREIHLANGDRLPYDCIVSTLPLDAMLRLTGLSVADPSGIRTAVLVLNIGGRKGPDLPGDHWVYLPSSRSGFHRVGVYSNVDALFVPNEDPELASFYVERAYPEGARPDAEAVDRYACEAVRELQEWGWLKEVHVMSPSWVETAYTWSRPKSAWREQAIEALRSHGILMTGRYGKWKFQGIADSLRDGIYAGAALRPEAP
ncbi:MAG: FAD-dependent oxidoreductase [Bryobacterales bacterium]|nr:FAD-dependent oxidoreductase [Bryobacterales bacterium]